MNGFITRTVAIELADAELSGDLSMAPRSRGMVVFVHGSGSSRHSPRNQFVATALQKRGFDTLLFDLLTEEEDSDYRTRFDIDLLTKRLLDVTAWIGRQKSIPPLPLYYFGASTGAAAALNAAAELGEQVDAVVSRGGRPDLALENLPRVRAPTLLIVGGYDEEVIALNEQAYAALRCAKKLAIVPRATHLFEEPGTLEEVARLAGEWFEHHCPSIAATALGE
jgi:pimeloyl-ACP methyl ester carboxylesterase